MTLFLDDNALTEGRTPQTDLSEGGQNGAMQSNYQWTANAPYARQKLIAVLVTAPAAMQYMEQPEKQRAILKDLVEVWAQSIDGLNASMTWEFDESPVGNAGEVMETVVGGKRQRSAPVFTWPEKKGMAITRFFSELGRQLLMDPDLGVPGIVGSANYIEAGSPSILPEDQSFTVLFFEPDETLTRVTNAWLITNMMSKSGGEILGKRTKGENNEVPTVSIEFTGLGMIGSSVNAMAIDYLSSLQLSDLRPLDLKPFADEIDPDVVAGAEGWASKVSDVVSPL